MKRTKAQRPIDVKDVPWSELGKDALDAAAEHLWNNVLRGPGKPPYHTLTYALDGTDQEILQQSVLDVVGSTVPALLRERAKSYRGEPEYAELYEQLRELADEIENEHG